LFAATINGHSGGGGDVGGRGGVASVEDSSRIHFHHHQAVTGFGSEPFLEADEDENEDDDDRSFRPCLPDIVSEATYDYFYRKHSY